jgi:hypothetical protein
VCVCVCERERGPGICLLEIGVAIFFPRESVGYLSHLIFEGGGDKDRACDTKCCAFLSERERVDGVSEKECQRERKRERES